MNKNGHLSSVSFALILFFTIASPLHSFAQKNPMKLMPKVITLDQSSPDSAQILHGPPETVTMRSGYMVLAPLKSVGKHSTKDNEEVIAILSGTGEMKIIGGSTLHLRPYCVAYCPPNTEHDVTNTGIDTLRYIYIVARAIK
jgi:mannose-6-phosphate isomerase-like protein (cupin superfamily)